MSVISPNCKYTDELLNTYTLEFGNDILNLGLAQARDNYATKIQELYNTLLNNNTLTNFENCIRYNIPTTAPSESISIGVIIIWIIAIVLVLLLLYFGYKIYTKESQIKKPTEDENVPKLSVNPLSATPVDNDNNYDADLAKAIANSLKESNNRKREKAPEKTLSVSDKVLIQQAMKEMAIVNSVNREEQSVDPDFLNNLPPDIQAEIRSHK
jgi:hypothetical protein